MTVHGLKDGTRINWGYNFETACNKFTTGLKYFTPEGLILSDTTTHICTPDLNTHTSGAVTWLWLEDQRVDYTASMFVRESSIMQAVCTTGLLCTVGKLSHGRLPASLTGEYADECVFIEKWLDADCPAVRAQPLVLVSVTSLNSYNNVGGNRVKRRR